MRYLWFYYYSVSIVLQIGVRHSFTLLFELVAGSFWESLTLPALFAIFCAFSPRGVKNLLAAFLSWKITYALSS